MHAAISRSAESAVSGSWSEYLMGGPSVWATVPHPPVTPTIESEIWQAIKSDPGASDPMVQFLLWKQNLDPERFASFHPKLAPALTKLTTPTTAPQQLIPPTSTTPGSGLPPPEPQRIPEPSSLLVAFGLIGWGIYWGRRGT
jgi:hypothetical protein